MQKRTAALLTTNIYLGTLSELHHKTVRAPTFKRSRTEILTSRVREMLWTESALSV
jgi:hypothetical protein